MGTPHYLAPEVLNQSYSEKCDIWAIGVIAYLLFSQGKYPFEGSNEMKLYKRIQKTQIYLPEVSKISKQVSQASLGAEFDWNTMMSEDAKDFIQVLLTKDANKRPSAQQALEHRWLAIDKQCQPARKAGSAAKLRR